jgi:hypothetical protein
MHELSMGGEIAISMDVGQICVWTKHKPLPTRPHQPIYIFDSFYKTLTSFVKHLQSSLKLHSIDSSQKFNSLLQHWACPVFHWVLVVVSQLFDRAPSDSISIFLSRGRSRSRHRPSKSLQQGKWLGPECRSRQSYHFLLLTSHRWKITRQARKKLWGSLGKKKVVFSTGNVRSKVDLWLSTKISLTCWKGRWMDIIREGSFHLWKLFDVERLDSELWRKLRRWWARSIRGAFFVDSGKRMTSRTRWRTSEGWYQRSKKTLQ